jgi:NhaP-type Na+/H+ or K+/H+ antiporter
VDTTILQIVVIVGAGIGAQWLAQLLRLPSIVFMLAAGVVVGPWLGWVDPDALLGPLLPPLVSLAVAIILFEGGLTLRFRDIASEKGVISRLISIGALVTWGVGVAGALIFLDVPTEVAVLLGAVLIVSGPTVVGPLLRQIRPHGSVGRILKWESILIDPLGAMVAAVVLEIVIARDGNVGSVIGQVLVFIGIGLGIGILGAGLMIPLLRWHVLPDRLHDSLTLAVALVAFVISNELANESGLLTVTVMGLVLANQRWAEIAHVQAFKENLVVLLLPAVFVVLAARLDPAAVAEIAVPVAGVVAVLVLVGRPLAVWLSTTPSGLDLREKAFLGWVAPRGVVAALVASVFAEDLVEAGIEADALVPATFVVIAACALIYGLTSPIVARALGLAESDPQGILILGAGPVERRIAAALDEAGVDVLLAATSRAHEYEARMSGLRTHFGDILGDDAADELDLRGIGRVLAITQNHEFNSLAALAFREDFGRGNVYQLHPGATVDSTGTESMPGRSLFSSEASYEGLASRLISGEEIRTTALTHNYPFDQLRTERPDMLGLFILRGDNVNVLTGRGVSARPGDRVTYLAKPTVGSTRPAMTD